MKSLTLSSIKHYEIDKLLLVLAAMWGLPFIFHFLPGLQGRALGAVWLPIFYAPLIAVILFKPHVSLFAAVLSPMINMFLTGNPTLSLCRMLTAELIVFVGVSQIILRRGKYLWVTGIAAYSVAKCVLFVLGISGQGKGLLDFAMNALPGMGVLFLITIIALKFREESI